ncbi:unnamed protein product [Allacma fusca]|uniref:Transporter n=1 Tax=Allacma fusca TaxID=39272 RepID=A0A8J2K7B8_9HEXA|nr:unnamed protein product [Allacma fusca]
MLPRERILTIARKEKWGNQQEFLLSSISLVLSYGNIWRFPYLCYKNGGGNFLIPYLICLMIVGLPMFLLEIAMGQYSCEGGITVWHVFAPRFKGVGISSAISCFLLNIYHVMILAWGFHYLIASFTYELPWSSCGNSWNTPNCDNNAEDYLESGNVTTNSNSLSTASEYWEHRVLGLDPNKDVEHLGTVRWELALTLLLSWIIVCACLWKGIRSLGKVSYLTATVPYLLLVFLLILGFTLEGAADGIRYYLTPDVTAIIRPQVWLDAATQVMLSQAVGLGCLTALGSYNRSNRDFVKDVKWIALVNGVTSFVAGLAMFSLLGFLAHTEGVSMSEVVRSGVGLVFTVFPKALSLLQWAPFWSIIFFSMLVLVVLGTHLVIFEGLITAVVDSFPQFFYVGYRRQALLIGIATFSYFVGLFMVTNGGLYVYELFEHYCFNGIILFWISFFQIAAIAGFYGESSIDTLLGCSPNCPRTWLRFCWKYLTPIFLGFMLLLSVWFYEPLTDYYGRPYPMWAHVIGWNLALPAFLSIIFYYVCYESSRPVKIESEKMKPLFP